MSGGGYAQGRNARMPDGDGHQVKGELDGGLPDAGLYSREMCA